MQRLAIGGAVLALWLAGCAPPLVEYKPPKALGHTFHVLKECEPDDGAREGAQQKRQPRGAAADEKSGSHGTAACKQAQHDTAREESDLEAQWRSAYAAENQVRLARRQIFWTQAEFFALLFTLAATALAAWAAAIAARASQEAVGVARLELESLGPVILERILDVTARGLRLDLRNAGGRNAIIQQIRAAHIYTGDPKWMDLKVKTMPEPVIRDFQWYDGSRILIDHPVVLAPTADDAELSLPVRFEPELSEDESFALLRGEQTLFFIVRFLYLDHLKTQWEKGVTYTLRLGPHGSQSVTAYQGKQYSYDRQLTQDAPPKGRR